MRSWNLQLACHDTEKTVSCKHLVLATGVGFQGACVPQLPGIELYGGVNIHSTSYKNAKLLMQKGVKVGDVFVSRFLILT
jgi:cation diffusion facilitator CzcD-associated flavoprotein CzcO